jgi:hypothetical protein
MDQGVADRHRDAEQQVVQDRVGDSASADLDERPPSLGCGPVDQFDHGRDLFQWIGDGGHSFEIRDLLEAAVRAAGA